MPTALGVVGLLIRTVLEDRMLHKELEGYKEYAQKTNPLGLVNIFFNFKCQLLNFYFSRFYFKAFHNFNIYFNSFQEKWY